MLPISSLPTSTTATATGDAPAAQPGETAQGADFLAILAGQSAEAAGAAPVLALTMTPDAAPAEMPVAANPASVPATLLPLPGKILPVAAPMLPEMPEALVEVPAQVKVTQPPALARSLLARMNPEEAKPAPKAKAAQNTVAPDAPSEETALEALPLPLLALVTPPPASPAPETSAPAPGTSRPAAQTAPQPASAPAQASDQQPSNPILAVTHPARPPQAAIELAPLVSAAPQVTADFRIATKPAAPDLPSAEQALPITASPVATGGIAPAGLPQAEAAARPHDFTALVDRIVAAREAMQPGAISIAVQHADFGPVQLHFRHDQAGLSVSMANPDPDFARAVSAAVTPVQQAAAPDSAALGSAPRHDQSGMFASDSGSQQRGQAMAQREARGPRANPAPQGQPQDGPSTSQHGIFA